jgi:O-antigen/teichoic acid export membrane protein
MGLNGAAFRGLRNMTGFLLFRALIPFFAVIPLLFYPQSGFITATEAYTYSTLLLCVMSFITWYRYSFIAKGNFEPKVTSGQIISDSLPMMLTGSVFFLLNWTDNLLLGIFRTEAEVGIYDSAFKIASASAIVLMGLNSIQAPSFSELFAKNKIRELNRQVQQGTRIIFLITLPFTILLFVFGEEILGLFGDEFRSAKTALLILAFGNFVSCISGSVGILLQMTGHQRPYNRIITTAAIGSIALNLYLIPHYGIIGAAITGCLAKIYQNLGAVIYTYRKMGIMTMYLPGINKVFPVKNTDTP